MSKEESILLAPLDPSFRPNFKIFQDMCNFLVTRNLSQDTFIYTLSPINTFLHLYGIHLFPQQLTYFAPERWNKGSLELYERLFYFEYLDHDPHYREWYTDEDGLREMRECIPAISDEAFSLSDIYFSRNELIKLKAFFNERYLIDMSIPLGHRLKDEIGLWGFDSYYAINVRYGFHFLKNRSVVKGREKEYFQLFPYAPRVLFGEKTPDDFGWENYDLLLTYAGSFSLSISGLTPWFGGEGGRYWAPEMTSEGNLDLLKSSPVFYHEFKPGLEEIFQQPMDVFIASLI